MEAKAENKRFDSVSDVTTEREAHPKRWYVAHVRSCCEKKTAAQIDALNIESFVPTQTEIRQWSDRKKKIERVVLPLFVFFRGTEEDSKRVESLLYVYSLLKAPGQKDAAVIPDDQIERFKFMIGNGDGEIHITQQPIKVGDKVKVVRGPLKGLEGYATSTPDGKTFISIVLENVFCASVTINSSDLEKQ